MDDTIVAFLAGYDNPATRQTYEKALRVFAEAVGPQRRLDEITPDLVDGWHQQLRATRLAVATVAKRTRVIKTFWNWCVRRGYISISPARFLVVKQPPPQPGSKAIPGEVLAAMFEAVQHKRCAFLAARDTALLALLITFGARAGDVTHLKLGGVDLNRQQIIFRVKGAKDLRLPLPPHTARYLAAWLAIRLQLQPEPAHDYVFVNIHTRPGSRHGPLASESLSTLVSRLSAQVSERAYGPHAIRHWRGQSLADQRVPPTVVQAILGHSSVQITLTHYYNPALGVFTAPDPLEGDIQQVMSLNRYNYVYSNPINITDPGGEIPTKNEVEDRTAVYSCKCGWIDFKHVRGGMKTFENIRNALTYPIFWPDNVFPNVRIISLRRGVSFQLPVTPFTARIWAYVPEAILTSPDQINRISLGISQEFEETFEAIQSYVNPLGPLGIGDPITGPRPSGFAEEDLPSDLIGFWLMKENLATIGTIQDDLIAKLQNDCDIMDVSPSLQVWEEYEKEKAWELGWKNWYRRPRPNEVTLPRCRSCSSETWPTKLVTFQPQKKEGTRWITGVYESSFLGWLPNILGYTGWWQLEGLQEAEIDYYQQLFKQFTGISNTDIYLIPTSPRLVPDRFSWRINRC